MSFAKKTNSQLEAGKLCSQSMRELSLVGIQHIVYNLPEPVGEVG